ncbi:hypothetical protein HNQ91_006061 [Filimonas zeae]|nr:hypothetical protein [Filimonas zeae]MDR6342974.1 hypothetical protein [Filimonas zeae]
MRLQHLAVRITGLEKMTPGLQTLIDVNNMSTSMLEELHVHTHQADKFTAPVMVHLYLQQISNISDQIHEYAMVVRKHVPEKRVFLQHITETITGTIKTIVTKWPSCNYLQMKVPAAFVYKNMRQLCPRWRAVQQQLTLFVQDENLLRIANTLVRKCRPEKNTRVTWHRFLYTEDLLANLEALLRRNYIEARFDDALIDLLVAMDYNEKDFSQYYIRHIEASINNTSNYYDKKKLLNRYADKLENLPNRIIPFVPVHAIAQHREYQPLKGRLKQVLTTYTSAVNHRQLLMEKEMRQLIWKKN